MRRGRLPRIALAVALLCASGIAACASQGSAREAAAADSCRSAPAETGEIATPAPPPAGSPEDRGESREPGETATAPAPAQPAPKPPSRPETRPPESAPPAPVTSSRPPVPSAQPPPASAARPVDLEQLTQRLKQTPAIGLFTKLELKNQIEDLVEKARASHERGDPSLEVLHERFDLLVLKLLSLLQDDEPALAAEVAASRDSLWAVLADPVQLSRL